MKQKWIWGLAAVLVAVAMIVLSDSKGMAVNHVLKNQQTLTAYALRCMEHPETATRYGSWNTRHNERYDVVQFQVRYVGFGSQSDETGFYYSSQDIACGFGNDQREEPSDKGVMFLGEGDNYTYVEKITDHWYWYEMHW